MLGVEYTTKPEPGSVSGEAEVATSTTVPFDAVRQPASATVSEVHVPPSGLVVGDRQQQARREIAGAE